MSEHFDDLEFAPDDDVPVPYMQRIRRYYQALGYGTPYRWAHYRDVPFSPLPAPLARLRVGLVTTAAPYQPDKGDQGPGAPYNADAKFYRVYAASSEGEPDVRIAHVGIDRAHTTAEDRNTWFPLAALKRAAGEGRVGAVSPRFYGAPTNRSQRTTVEQDCHDLLAALREDAVEAAVLAAN